MSRITIRCTGDRGRGGFSRFHRQSFIAIFIARVSLLFWNVALPTARELKTVMHHGLPTSS